MRIAAALAAGALLSTLLGGCGPSAPEGALVVPALWAARSATGEQVGGMELATVSVGTIGEPGFSVDLADVEARGAGPQWLAATSLAATVATLYSREDPRTVDVHYTITGPIDGPSAGAILTVGTLAALRGDTLRPGVTMTGTIAPDGTIGVVDLVPTKVRSAAEAGYTTVLIPFGTERQSLGAGQEPLDVIALGKALGVDVRVVLDLGEAYDIFTGVRVEPALEPPALDPAVRDLSARQADSLAQQVQQAFARIEPALPAEQRVLLAAQVEAVVAAQASGDSALTYGLAVDAYRVIERASAEVDLREKLASAGVQASVDGLSAEVEQLRATAALLMAEGTRISGLGLEQVISMAYALGWTVYADASLSSLNQYLTGLQPDEAMLLEVARVVADDRAALEVFGPNAMAIARAASSNALPDEQATAEFLSGYTNFLVGSGNANVAYFRSVVGATGLRGPGDAEAVAQILAARAAQTPVGRDPLADETGQLANAVTFFIAGQAMVSGASFGMTGSGLGSDPISGERRDPVTANAVETGAENALVWASRAQEGGSGIDYAVWQTQWGHALFRALDGTDREDAAAVEALDEIWHAVLNCLMSLSAKQALASPSS